MNGAATGGKRVVYTLAAEIDKDAKKAFDDFAKYGADSHRRAGESAVKAEKERGDSFRKQEKTRWDALTKLGAYEQKLNDDDKKAHEDKMRRIRSAADAHETAVAKMKNAQLRFARSIGEVGEGVTRLVRGFAYLGLAGEENLQKVLSVLLKLEGTVSIIQGGIKVYSNITRGVQAYTAAVTAAAAAEAALAAARGVSAASGGASGVAGAAGSVVGGVGGSMKILSGVLTSGAAKIAGGLSLLAGSLYGVAKAGSLISDVQGGGATYTAAEAREAAGLGGFWNPLNLVMQPVAGAMGVYGDINAAEASEKKTAVYEASLQTSKNRLSLDTQRNQTRIAINAQQLGGDYGVNMAAAGAMDRGDKRGPQVQLGVAVNAVQAIRQQMSEAQAEIAKTNDTAIIGPAKEYIASLQPQLIAGLKEQERLATAVGEAAVNAAQKELAAKQTTLEVAKRAYAQQKRAADELEASTKSDVEKFADLDTAGQQRLARIQQRLAGGQKLTKDERDFAGQFNTLKDRVSAQRLSEGYAEGASRALGNPLADVERARDRQNRLANIIGEKQTAVAKIDHKIEFEITPKNERDLKLISDAIVKAMLDSEERVRKMLNEKLAEIEGKNVQGGVGAAAPF